MNVDGKSRTQLAADRMALGSARGRHPPATSAAQGEAMTSSSNPRSGLESACSACSR
jgi:hypothetical protein